MKRREFLKDVTAVLAIGVTTQTLIGCSKESVTPASVNFSIDLKDTKYNSLKTVGGVALVNGIYIVRSSQSAYLALSRICTHAGCSVNYNSSGNDFVCPCHGGVYSITGSVISGPPPAPLANYKTTLNGDILSVG